MSSVQSNLCRTFQHYLLSSAFELYQVQTILQSHAEGSSLRGVSRISGRAYGTVVSLITDASHKGQMVDHAEVKQVKVSNTEGKTDCKSWNTDDWGSDEPVLEVEILYYRVCSQRQT